MTAAVFSVTCLEMSFDVAALDPAHVERRARQEEPLLRRLPRGGCARGGAAVKTLFDGGDVRAPGRILNAILKAFSLASAPELIQNTLSKGRFANLSSRCAARARISMGTALVWKFICAAWSASAFVQPLCP
jgi:hypothetical protein